MSSDANEKIAISDVDDFSQSEEEYDGAHPRPSEDVRRHDQETLTAEEEAERLLGGEDEKGGKSISQRFTDKREARRKRRRDARHDRRSKKSNEGSELLYDTEQGRRSSSESSSEAEMRRLKEKSTTKKSRASRFAGFTVIHVVIIVAFLALLYGAYHATTHRSSRPIIAQKLSNGTHTFLPTTLLVSLDGFRADFLTRNLTPTLNGFIQDGVSPRYMMPSFPSLTFPNHFTLVTGLHPESHGIVGNTFWDPNTSKEFYYTDPDRSMHPEWWNAEPLWLTAELAGVRSAIHMWPGSEAHIGSIEPAYVDEFNGQEQLGKKVDKIFSWLDLPGSEDESADPERPRPQLIAAYVPDVDRDGHQYGPNSTYIRSTIAEVDGMLASIFHKIDERNLTDIVNIIVVSDHGMATTSINRLIQLEDLVDIKLIEHTDGWPLYGLRPYDNSSAHLDKLYNDLVAKAELPQYHEAFDVYLRDKNMPARYHFTKNHRIAPLWIVPKVGWAIVTKEEFDIPLSKQHGDVYKPRGLHGYDFEHPLMRAIFVARGPAFPHPKGSRVREFGNVDVYNIVCDSLGLEPRPNNGTLRLPFKTQGVHDFTPHNAVDIEIPHDPQDDYDETADLANLNFGVPPVLPTGPLPPVEPATPSAPLQPAEPTSPAMPDGETEGVEVEKGFKSWWEWVKSRLEQIKGWAGEKLGGAKEQEGNNGTAAKSP